MVLAVMREPARGRPRRGVVGARWRGYTGPMPMPRRRPLNALDIAAASDNDLVRWTREGSSDAEDALVRRHYKKVFNLAYRLSSDHDRAQDIAAEAFIRVHNALPNFRGDANFTTWLYRIVYNVFLDDRKKQRLRNHASLDDMIDLDESTVTRQVEDPSPGPQALVEESERSSLLRRAVEALSPQQRAMIAMYHFQHMSYEEIAEAMTLPIGTVKSRLNRARLSLRSKLAENRELLER